MKEKKDFVCPICEKSFSKQTYVKNHISTVHEEKRILYVLYVKNLFQSRLTLKIIYQLSMKKERNLYVTYVKSHLLIRAILKNISLSCMKEERISHVKYVTKSLDEKV